jgi:hypothetical protein
MGSYVETEMTIRGNVLRMQYLFAIFDAKSLSYELLTITYCFYLFFLHYSVTSKYIALHCRPTNQ